MSNIKAIHAGEYIDELNVDALEEKKSGSTPVIAKVPKRQTSTEI